MAQLFSRLLSNSYFPDGLLEQNTTLYVWFSRILTTKSGREKPQQLSAVANADSGEVLTKLHMKHFGKVLQKVRWTVETPAWRCTEKGERGAVCYTPDRHSRSARARTKQTKGIHDRPRFLRKRPT